MKSFISFTLLLTFLACTSPTIPINSEPQIKGYRYALFCAPTNKPDETKRLTIWTYDKAFVQNAYSIIGDNSHYTYWIDTQTVYY